MMLPGFLRDFSLEACLFIFCFVETSSYAPILHLLEVTIGSFRQLHHVFFVIIIHSHGKNLQTIQQKKSKFFFLFKHLFPFPWSSHHYHQFLVHPFRYSTHIYFSVSWSVKWSLELVFSFGGSGRGVLQMKACSTQSCVLWCLLECVACIHCLYNCVCDIGFWRCLTIRM